MFERIPLIKMMDGAQKKLNERDEINRGREGIGRMAQKKSDAIQNLALVKNTVKVKNLTTVKNISKLEIR